MYLLKVKYIILADSNGAGFLYIKNEQHLRLVAHDISGSINMYSKYQDKGIKRHWN